MSKFYQPAIKKEADNIINSLKESGFFTDFEIEDDKFARIHLCEKLTEKFIKGDLDSDNIGVFNEEEFDYILKEIIAGSMLNQLKSKGLVNSYEDDETEEVFFLTEEGKKHLQDLRKNTE